MRQFAFQLGQGLIGKELGIAIFSGRRMQRNGGGRHIIDHKLARCLAFMQNTLKDATLAAQAFNLKLRPVRHNNLRQFKGFGLIFK